ncbi:putative acetyltransferase [Labrenzia sp. THAF82]|uniref:GNAT family N-acetyltransferase n=1 Tax=Labrenzia sp. THAF82 TaxID=2587861 RepID=UPI001267A4EB|nr:GNAT family N-acetyltransferase [Labrenzia sp. THAF82]QFT29475.1 putative acetyltransferase [Labrenzia sp. THAF82]QFT29598.1 putative acetyltransferase [Labrenzia sp. THAF82]
MQEISFKSNFSVRSYKATDIFRVADLIAELQVFHDLSVQDREDILWDLNNIPASFEVWVVCDANDIPVGLAMCASIPGPGIKAGLFLKEIFVSSSYRNHGLGKMLIRKVVASARDRGMLRIDWLASADNKKAHDFYKQIGAKDCDSVVFFRIDSPILDNFPDL